MVSRIFLLYAVALSLTIILGGALFFRFNLTQRLEDAQYTASMLIEVMTQAIQESVIIGDYDLVKRTLESAVTHTPFDKASFIDLSGATIALGKEGEASGYVPNWLISLISERIFDVNRVIVVGGRDYGVLRLSFNVAAASEELWTLIKGAIALIAVSLGLGLAVVRALLMRWLTNLNLLKSLEERVQIGELDAQAQLTNDAPLEIRQAVDIVNRTALSLRSQFGQRIDALMNALVQHKSALDQTAIVSEIDAQGRISLVNDLYCKKLEKSRDELIGSPVSVDGAAFVPPSEIWRGAVLLESSNGGRLWLNRTIIPIYDAAGAVEKWICIDIDVSAQKLAEEELRAAYRQSEELAERHFKAILDSVGDGVVIADNSGTITDVNRMMQEIFDLSRSEMVGRPLHSLIGEVNLPVLNDRFHEEHLQVIDSAGEHMGKRGDGSLFPIELALGRLEGEGPPLFIGVVRDVTERRKSQESLRQAKEMAEAGNRAKSDFLATMSHEIRTPMNGVLGMLSLLDFEDLQPGQREKVTVARQSAEALLNIVDDILDFSKLEAGRIELEMTACDPSRITEAVVQVLRGKAEEKGLQVSCRISPTTPRAVFTDQARLRQILNNLIGNAIKFTPSGGVAVRVQAGDCLSDNRVELVFEIEDTGIGIAPEAARTLFRRFHQADNSITRRFGGTGLGLAICKDLCALLGGDINVKSAPQGGSLFTFTIACDIADPACLPAESNLVADAEDIVALPELRILVVDDNEINRDIVRALLQRHNHQVSVAANGLEAVDAVMRTPFDLVLMDVQMPEMDGMTATRRIRILPEPKCRMPVVAFTAHASAAVWQECAAAGMNALATKPVRIKPLLAAMAQALGVGSPSLPAPVGSPAPHVAPPSSPPAAATSLNLLDMEQVTMMREALPEDWPEIIEQFRLASEKQIEELQQALLTERPYKTYAHTLKGVALNVGAAKLAAMALTIEQDDAAAARRSVENLTATLRATVDALEQIA